MTDVVVPSESRRPVPDRLPDCPYKGLQAYTEADGDYFFGRDADRDLVIANLMASRLTLLYGPSGVGKSSLLQAGVVRHLHRLADGAFSYLAVGRAVVVYFATWRDDPVDGLGAALLAAARRSGLDGGAPANGPLSLEMLRSISEQLDADVILLLDQAEDFVTYHSGRSGDAFAALLGRVVGTAGLRTSVVIGIREDALAKLDRLEAHVPGLFGNSLRLDHLGAAAAREAIEQPLARYNESAAEPVRIEPDLVDELLRELRTGRVSVTDSGRGTADPGAATIETPFLQLVMTRLWGAEMAQGSRVLRRETLAGLGGAERIVRTHLDSVMAELTDAQQQVAASVFRHLVTPSGMKVAHTADDLADYAGTPDRHMLAEVLERLAAGRERILRPVPPPVDQAGPPRYEIFHDVMAPAVLDWRRRHEADREITEARLRAEEQHRRTRRRLLVSWAVSGLLAALLVVAVGAIVLAKRSGDEAEHTGLIARYGDQLQRDPAAALRAGLGAWKVRHSAAAETAVRTAFDADNTRFILNGHRGPVLGSVFSPDGRTLLTAGNDGTASLFDSGTGRQLRVLAVPGAGGSAVLNGASFSPDATLVVTTAVNGQIQVYEAGGRWLGRIGAYREGTFARWTTRGGRLALLTWSWEGSAARLWDARTRKQLVRYGNDQEQAWDAALSPDGKQTVTAGADGVLTVWDTATGRRLARSEAIGFNAAVPAFVDGSDRVAFLGQTSWQGYWYVMFWDWRTGGETVAKTEEWGRQAVPMAVTPGGRTVAVALDKKVIFFDGASGKVVGRTPEEADWVNAVALSGDGRWMVTGGNDGRTRVWITRRWDNRPVAEMLGHRGAINAVAFDPRDPWKLATASYDGTARIWQLPARTVLGGAWSWVLDANYSPGGGYIVAAEESGALRVYDRRGKLIKELKEYSGSDLMNGARFTPDAKRVVYTTSGGTAPRMVDWRTGTQPVFFDRSDRLLLGPAVSPDGTEVAAGDRINRVIVWDTNTGKIDRVLSGGNPDEIVIRTEYVPGTTTIAAASTDGTVRLYAGDDKRPVRTIGQPGQSSLRAMTVSRDGRLVLTASTDRVVRLWRLSDGVLLREIEGPASTISGVALNADASMIAVSAADGAVHVWAADGRKITSLRRHGDAVNAVQFTPDGKGFLTASDDSTAAIFPCTTCGAFDDVRRAAEARDESR